MEAFFHFKKNKTIYIILFLFLIAKLLTLSYYKIAWWDSSVYIGMGKYIYSLGDAGLWENSRPIIWPLMLGFLWKAGFNVVSVGRIIEIIFGGLCIFLVYLIGERLFNQKTAALSSIFLALSPTFFFFNGILLTEVISTLFALIAVYLFISRKYFVSGIFFGIAFMTRFLQLLSFIGIILTVLFYFNKKIKIIKKISSGFFVAVSPYLVLNYVLYKNPIAPFLQQAFLAGNSGWANYHPFSYYFISLFKENFLYIFLIIGIILVFKDKNTGKIPVLSIFLLFFVFFSVVNQKEMRFLIVLLPYMYMLASYSIVYFFEENKNKIFRAGVLAVIALSLVFSAAEISDYYKNESSKSNWHKEFQILLDDSYGRIWISNPTMAVFSDKKIDNLMYYPVFNEEKNKELMDGNPDFVFLDTCDLTCKPSDFGCGEMKKDLLEHFKNRFKATYSNGTGYCEQFAFRRSRQPQK